MSINGLTPAYTVFIIDMGDTDGQTDGGRQIKQTLGFVQVAFRDSSGNPVNNVQIQVSFGQQDETRLTLDYNGQIACEPRNDITRFFWNNTPGVFAHIVISPSAALFQNDCPNPLQTFTTNVGTIFQSGAVTVAASATLLSAANTDRQSIGIYNNDASVTMYIGDSGVTTTNGYPIPAGGQAFFDKSTAAIYGIVAAGSINARIITESI